MIFERWGEWFPQLVEGLGMSLALTGVTAALGLPFGLLFAVISVGGPVWVRRLMVAFIEVCRGIPLLAVIYLFYFGLPDAGITLTAFVTMVMAHGLNLAAYSSEVFRAGILHVPKGQTEAVSSLGISPTKGFFHVVLPQALRAVLGPLTSLLIMVFQSTSLAFAIGVGELTSKAFSIGAMTFQYFNVLVLAGVMYAVICIVSSRIVANVEHRLKVER
ncbi:amino acid ABC transporter permease [Gulosibacter sp. ACHW.36C]|uniref:Amino acid ABC transporter permease n=1 Tax=Gulosibacter sediminis TaxID=1729695 RepID=A0ABY4MXG7_9MICO|nr:amino acid ABC transporter permease [Gulosibacter sediminis]UQN15120.1 amino acid ABC transporter permease [Gulosibacter sediminis]